MITEQDIRALVAAGTRIDPERVTVRTEDDVLVVGITACTEAQQRGARAVLNQYVGEHREWRVVRDETPARAPAYDVDKLRVVIERLGEAPDGQLDEMFSARCRGLPADVPLDVVLKFLRNLRDECVFCAGASGFVMTLFNCLLEDYPETEDAMAERRAELEARYGM